MINNYFLTSQFFCSSLDISRSVFRKFRPFFKHFPLYPSCVACTLKSLSHFRSDNTQRTFRADAMAPLSIRFTQMSQHSTNTFHISDSMKMIAIPFVTTVSQHIYHDDNTILVSCAKFHGDQLSIYVNKNSSAIWVASAIFMKSYCLTITSNSLCWPYTGWKSIYKLFAGANNCL